LIPYELGGTVDLVHAPEGVRCRLEIAADWLTSGDLPRDRSVNPDLWRYPTYQGGQQF
jgi:hypothetical protein